MTAGGVNSETPSTGGRDTQYLIRHAALQLIGQKGFAAMSMRQLAGLVGIQAGSLYRYVPSKHCLLFELLCEYFGDLLAAWQQAGASPMEKVVIFVDNASMHSWGVATMKLEPTQELHWRAYST